MTGTMLGEPGPETLSNLVLCLILGALATKYGVQVLQPLYVLNARIIGFCQLKLSTSLAPG